MQALLDFLLLGGFVVQVLVIFSIVATTVILFKLWQFFQQRPIKNARPEQALHHAEKGEYHRALLLMQNQKNPRAHVLAETLHLVEDDGLTLEDVRDESARIAQSEIAKQQAWLRILEVIAMLAPLLGLFGTVLGMISAFQAMEQAGAQVDPSILSGGIWKALLTTAAGLAVAIPVSLIHSWLERKVETVAHAMADDLQRFFTCFKKRAGVAEASVKKHA